MDNRLKRTLRPRSIAATSVCCLLLFAATARAQSVEAEALFSDGDTLMKQGKLAQACDAFEASNRLEARAGTLIRLGECREKNGQLASAWSAYKDALTRVKDPRKKAIATAKVAELESKLSHLTVSVSTADRIDGLVLTRNGQVLDPALWNRALPVNGGQYTIGCHAPGYEAWSITTTVPGERGKISVDVPKLKTLTKPAPASKPQTTVMAATVLPKQAPTPEQVARPASPRMQGAELAPSSGPDLRSARDQSQATTDDRPPSPTWTTRRTVAIGAAGGAALALAAGAVLGMQATTKQDDAYALCPDPRMPCADADRADALIESGQRGALRANIAFGVGAAAAIVAGVLWLTGTPESKPDRVVIAPSIAPGETTIAMFGRF